MMQIHKFRLGQNCVVEVTKVPQHINKNKLYLIYQVKYFHTVTHFKSYEEILIDYFISAPLSTNC